MLKTSYTPCPEKKGINSILGITSPILADFQNSSSVAICWKFAIKLLINFPPHLKCIATLPCKKLMSEN